MSETSRSGRHRRRGDWILHCPVHGLKFDLAKRGAIGAGELCLRHLPVREIGGMLMMQTNSSDDP